MNDLPVLILEGTPRQRGRAHGEALRALIVEFNDRWREDIRADLNIDPDEYIRELVERNHFLPAVKKWTPELLEEVEGIAEGCGVDLATIFARQLSDEDWLYRMARKFPVEHCSALGVRADGSTLVAQNMDTPAFWDGAQALLHLKYPDGLEMFMFTAAGQIALCGMNNRGVGLCCNAMLQCETNPRGLPECFVVRTALEQSSVDEAAAFIRRVDHASPQNYLIGDPQRVIDLEVSANKVCEYAPHANRVYHTNHPLVNDDQSAYRRRLAAMSDHEREAFLGQWTTAARFDLLQSRLGDPEQPVTMDTIRSVLSAPPVCRHSESSSMTLGCCIMELSPAPRLHLAPGPPDVTAFRTHTFEALSDRTFNAKTQRRKAKP
jgi:predicted choloylglycine hydrolase